MTPSSTPIKAVMSPRMQVLASAFICALILFAQPLQAEIVKQDENGFFVRHQVEVAVNADEAYEMLRAPAKWWAPQHSWTGDAENLYMDAQASGCFCELIPAKEEGGPRGSVEHMRIVYAEPGKILRLVGGLGPLQGEAVYATMTVQLLPADNGTLVRFDYVVGGYMRFPVQKIAPAVDGVIGDQAARLAKILGGPQTDGADENPAAPDGDADGPDETAEE